MWPSPELLPSLLVWGAWARRCSGAAGREQGGGTRVDVCFVQGYAGGERGGIEVWKRCLGMKNVRDKLFSHGYMLGLG